LKQQKKEVDAPRAMDGQSQNRASPVFQFDMEKFFFLFSGSLSFLFGCLLCAWLLLPFPTNPNCFSACAHRWKEGGGGGRGYALEGRGDAAQLEGGWCGACGINGISCTEAGANRTNLRQTPQPEAGGGVGPERASVPIGGGAGAESPHNFLCRPTHPYPTTCDQTDSRLLARSRLRCRERQPRRRGRRPRLSGRLSAKS